MAARVENPWARWGSPAPSLKGKVLTFEEKSYLAQLVNEDELSVTDVAKKFGLSKQVISKYAGAIKRGKTLFAAGGRPPVVDEVATQQLVDSLQGEKRIQSTSNEFKKRFREAVVETAGRRNLSAMQAKPPSRKTITDWEKKHSVLTLTNPEETTEARKVACADIRNMVSVMAAFARSQKVQPYNIANFDASTYKVGDCAAPKPTAKMIGKVQGNKSVKVIKEDGRKGLISFFIKVYTGMTATGRHFPQVYCIASSQMEENQIDAHRIEGIGFSGFPVGDEAYIVFCRTRNMCLKFYEWYWETIVLPKMSQVRADHQDPDGVQLVNCDGEDIQIALFSKSTSIVDKILAANISVDKSPASTTEITQAMDCGKIFLSVKTKLKSLDLDTIPGSRSAFPSLATIWADHQNQIKVNLTTDHVRMGIEGVLKVVAAFRAIWTVPKASASFQSTGQVPFDTSTIMKNCTTKLTLWEETKIMKALPELIKLFEENGQLVTEDFDKYQIPNNTAGTAKEKLTISRQRAVTLTHPATRLRLAEAERLKNEKKALKEAKKAANAAKPAKLKKAYNPHNKRKRS